MAGLLTRTIATSSSLSLLRLSLSSSLTSHRHRSNKSGKSAAHLIEFDLESSSSPTSSTSIRKLEDVIYNIIVRRSAPDWLPFLPGSSYWVPPRRLRGPTGLVDLIGNLGAPPPLRPSEETLALSSVRGFPSSSYYIQGTAPTRPLPMDVQVVEIKFQEDSDCDSQSEDEKQ